jgi:hypothetical protein
MNRLAFAPFVALLFACSSSTGGGAAGDGFDASVPDGGNHPEVASTCPSIQAWSTSCEPGASCGAYLVSECGAYDEYFSAGARLAIATCFEVTVSSCSADAAGSADVGACLEQQLSGLGPTAEQQALAVDYCAECSPGDATCADAFFTSGDGGGATGFAATVLMMSDTLVMQIDTSCAHANLDAGACADALAECAAGVYASVLPSLACPVADGGGA